MKIKKIFAFILASAILISSLSLHSFADCTTVISGNNPINFPGQNISLNSDIKCEIKGFSANPYKVPGLPAFISGKCEIKIDPSKLSPDNQYYGNGGCVYLYVNKATNAWHFDSWENLLSYKPKSNINSFKINGPKQSVLQPFFNIFSLFDPLNLSVINIILWIVGIPIFMRCFDYLNSYMTSYLNSYMTSYLNPYVTSCIKYIINIIKYPLIALTPIMAIIKLLAAATLPSILNVSFKAINELIAPLNNLYANVNVNSVDFDYGIVLTDKDDEQVLDANNLPKPGDINIKALRDWKKKQTKENQILIDNQLKAAATPGFKLGMGGKIVLPENCYYTQNDIDKMKENIEKHKAITYAKLANSVPITDGFVCKLDREHPSQTFRLVINNQFPDNPNNADLFALALKNNNINLAQTDARINFTALYTPLASDSDFMARLSNASFETQQKVNFIKNVGNPGFLSETFSNIIKWFKNHFAWSQGVPAGGAVVDNQQGGGHPPAGGGHPPAGGGHPPAGGAARPGPRPAGGVRPPAGAGMFPYQIIYSPIVYPPAGSPGGYQPIPQPSAAFPGGDPRVSGQPQVLSFPFGPPNADQVLTQVNDGSSDDESS